MKPLFPSNFEPRQRSALAQELLARAQDWIPELQPADPSTDAVHALFNIAARIEAEVTQRLAQMPAKTYRGMLAWLGVTGLPGRAAQIPVAFRLSAGAQAVRAPSLVQMQANLASGSVVFETRASLMLTPASLVSMIGADPASDRWFQAPPGLVTPVAPASVPNSWLLVSDAPATGAQLQLAPPLGLAKGDVIVDPNNRQYQLDAVNGGLVTVDVNVKAAKLDAAAPATLVSGTQFKRSVVFDPFGLAALNQQLHALYLGAKELLDVQIPAVFEIVAGDGLLPDAQWSWWGTVSNSTPPAWLDLTAVRFNGHLYLVKLAGNATARAIGGQTGYWLRAMPPPGPPGNASYVGALKISIENPPPGGWPSAVQHLLGKTERPSVKLAGVAGTTPLVMNFPFYPLGTTPRLFDAFYLGSQEAFAKVGASVTCEFTLGDGLGAPPVALTSGGVPFGLGVGRDGRLHRFDFTPAAAAGAPVGTVSFEPQAFAPTASDGRPVMLDLDLRPGALTFQNTGYLTASGGGEIWRWQADVPNDKPSWFSLGALPDAPDGKPDPAQTLLVTTRPANGVRAYALRSGALFQRDALQPDEWHALKLVDNHREVSLARIVRVVPQAQPDGGNEGDGLLCVADNGRLFIGDAIAGWVSVAPDIRLDPNVYPLAVRDAASGLIRCISADRTPTGDRKQQLVAFEFTRPPATNPAAAPNAPQRVTATLAHGALAFATGGNGTPLAIFVIDDDGQTKPAMWDPFGSNELAFADRPLGAGAMTTAPLPFDNADIAFPTEDGSLALTHIDATAIGRLDAAALSDAVSFTTQLDLGDKPADLYVHLAHPDGADAIRSVQAIVASDTRRSLVLPSAEAPTLEPVATVVYRATGDAMDGKLGANALLDLYAGDTTTAVGSLLYIERKNVALRNAPQIVIANVVEIVVSGASKKARLEGTVSMRTGTVSYRPIAQLLQTSAIVRPAVNVKPLAPALHAVLNHASLRLVDKQGRPFAPPVQRVLQFDADWAILEEAWNVLEADVATLHVFGGFTAWSLATIPLSINPKLSWEFWDGRGWSPLETTQETTGDLLHSGHVTFTVPAGLVPTDVAGQTNSWIRARLVSGDYGQESVTVTTTTLPNGKTQQSVERSAGTLHPPYVTSLVARYSVIDAVAPDFVVSMDGGIVRDQSAANRTPNALVEYFAPLSNQLAGAGTANTADAANTAACCRACADDSAPASAPAAVSASSAVASTSTAAAAAAAGGRAVYLGFDGEIAGDGITLLFAVLDGNFDDANPLRVEAWIDGQFQHVAASDETRGLNETGLVTLSLPGSPQAAMLFGATPLYWLRLRPNALADAANWQPRIKGAYINAATATAAETQTNERLGSSDGSPGQRVTLARTPVLANSLELRICEPLADEDVAALRKADASSVMDSIGQWPGPWVRWTQVNDLMGSGPKDRVYTLDDDADKGTITFGDSKHGMIPPPGTGSIVAHTYQCVGNSAANALPAWSELTLTTPVTGVQSIVALDNAAGGTDPEDAQATLQYASVNLAMRDRAVTPGDFEQLALQFVPDIAQARALPTPGGLKLVVAVRGDDPRPSNATQRELRLALLDQAAPMFARPGGLQVVPPVLVAAQIKLSMTTAAIEFSAAIEADARQRIVALLDPATGAIDQGGWRFGDVPSETDIAASLDGIAHVAAIESITVSLAGSPRLPLAANQLVYVTPDAIRVDLQSDSAGGSS
ncbi:putative phage baseplate assembly protein [Paraburkholderia sp. BL27I4N3]|uniref:hypothetical protein n=1 Tax=Paraburkholderia sp. BL27I4N3 TaxID=1938805 RepID=UPI000E232C84|nr:hypothetical protein [Paraburkholderia sp. BL27I4N3]REE18416.1 putative phage baseplate assembly protein [Paraburkholderia sp. BL27I4N3]